MQPVTGVPVRIEVSRLEGDGREVPLDILSMQREGSDNPRFKVELPALPPGEYRLRGEAELAGRVVPSQDVDIAVSEVSVEFQRVAQDRSNLIRLASQTRGAYSNTDGAAAMVGQINLEPRVIESTAEISLRTSTIVFVAILLLLGVEWVIRKRVGMV